jgi:hypothetical protein
LFLLGFAYGGRGLDDLRAELLLEDLELLL